MSHVDARQGVGHATFANNPTHVKPAIGAAPSRSSPRHVFCLKNPRHENFTPVYSLKPQHLPAPYDQDPRWVSMLQARADDTVKLRVNYTSPARPDAFKCRDGSGAGVVRHGTGTAFWTRLLSSRMRCPFPDCTVGGSRDHDVYGPFRVVTVAHLVYNEEEANCTTVEFFDDDPDDRSSVCRAQVTGLIREPMESDRCILICVTHDPTIPERLERSCTQRNELLQQLQEPDERGMCVLISHPHGMSKRISVGRLLNVEEQGPVKRTKDCQMLLRDCRLVYSTPSCMGSGGGSVTLWCRGKRAFAPHCRTLGEDRNQSALGWISVPENRENGPSNRVPKN
ncbi:hypothetical protein EGW08_006968 [Elysia chlorotica]|uniref:Uncharacterized protein n=1 Tax=Elysia chlorotica TaxID=188477 RepID=A0A3S1A8F2_ELYCH|nr:hypothetical protein EGW08_006968 [Elysia chlorotica]